MSAEPTATVRQRIAAAIRSAIVGPWLTDLGAVVLALATVFGATRRIPIPWPFALAGVVFAVASRRPPLVWFAAAVAAGSLAHTAEVGMVLPASGTVTGEVTLVSDPAPIRRGSADLTGGVRVIGRFEGKHVEVRAVGPGALPFVDALAGQRFSVDGELVALPETAGFLARRHVVGRLSIVSAREVGRPWLPYVLANGLRRTIEQGAASLDPTERSLYTGLVFGDDRLQSEAVSDRFRASGLGHLLAVSGQNVAFVLLLVRPLLGRVSFAPRLVMTVGVLLFFALITRFEPSVCRATAMACGVAFAAAWGRPMSGVRVLSLTVTVLLLADPFLVSSVGFLLSVAASAGIMIGASPLAATIGGPRPLAEALAVPLAAQLAVGPVLIVVFGGLPPASFPANVAVGPAAGWVMAYGMTIGVVAGVVPPEVANLLHAPTGVLLGWIDGVATHAESLGWGQIGGVGFAVAVALALVLFLGRPLGGAAVAGCGVVLLLALALRPDAVGSTQPHEAVELWRGRSSGVVAVIDGGQLHAAKPDGLPGPNGVSVDVLVILGAVPGSPIFDQLVASWQPHGLLVAARSDRWPVSTVLGVEVFEVEPGERIRVGDLVVEVQTGGPRLTVDVVSA